MVPFSDVGVIVPRNKSRARGHHHCVTRMTQAARRRPARARRAGGVFRCDGMCDSTPVRRSPSPRARARRRARRRPRPTRYRPARRSAATSTRRRPSRVRRTCTVEYIHYIALHYITLHDPPQSGSPMRHVFSFHHHARRWVVEEMTMTKGVCVCTCTARFRQPGCGDRPTVEDTMTRAGNRPLPPARLWGPVATAAPQRPEAEDTGGTL